MLRYTCPACGKPLWDMGNTFRCPSGHSYDKSRQGYVNLLMSNKSSSKRHGDDRLMTLSRREFLDHGYFAPLLCRIGEIAQKYTPAGRVSLLDAGCGEGYYTTGVKNAIEASDREVDAFGVDISRDALLQAHRRDSSLHLAVAGINRLPVPDGECDILLNIFSPCFPEEFSRVLSSCGVLIRAVPLSRHLLGLKAKIYDLPYENREASPELPPLHLLETQEIKYNLALQSKADILDLFKMTPYYYKTSAADQEKLMTLDKLETEVEIGVWVYGLTGMANI